MSINVLEVSKHSTLVELRNLVEMLPTNEVKLRMYQVLRDLISMAKVSALMQGMPAGRKVLSSTKSPSLIDAFEMDKFISSINEEIAKYKK